MMIKLCSRCDCTYEGPTYNRRYCSPYCAAPFRTWTISTAMSGYAPDPDSVHTFAHWLDARDCLLSDLKLIGDGYAQGYGGYEDDADIDRALASLDEARDFLAHALPGQELIAISLDTRGYTWAHAIAASAEKPD